LATLVMLSSMLVTRAEQATAQSVPVVVPAEQESVKEELLLSLVVVSVLDSEVLLVGTLSVLDSGGELDEGDLAHHHHWDLVRLRVWEESCSCAETESVYRGNGKMGDAASAKESRGFLAISRQRFLLRSRNTRLQEPWLLSYLHPLW
jgi:hypothetical protein